MNEGFCFGDGEAYFKHENDAYDYALSLGYKGLQDAYDDDAYYYTEWMEDYQYEEINGVLVEI